jgi:uncharacterized coiled-coil protein SlyX
MIQDYIKQYWPIFFSIGTVLVSIFAQWTLLGYRISAVEGRQDRQSTTIASIQAQISSQASDYAALSAKLDAIDSNVTYIRQRLDNDTTISRNF